MSGGGVRPPPEISICICSFRRPRGLAKLLDSLTGLVAETPSREIIVVDNDAARTAAPVVERAADGGLDVTYLVEPIQNICKARNRSILAARGSYVAFIDDDQEATAVWLAELHHELTSRGADAAFGPVFARFSVPPPAWIRDVGFFEYEFLGTGTRPVWHQTRDSNSLVRRDVLLRLPYLFDEALGLTGGGDCDLFARMIERGDRLIAVDTAVVYETVLPERATFAWLAQRYYRNGMTTARVTRRFLSRTERGRQFLWAVVMTVIRSIRGLLALPFSRGRGARLLLEGLLCLGIVACRLGLSYEEYKLRPKMKGAHG